MKAAGLALSGERLLATSQFHQQLPIVLYLLVLIAHPYWTTALNSRYRFQPLPV